MNAMHPVFANRGYQHGRVVLISTHTALTSMATGVVVGIGVLDEAWPARPLMGALRALAFALMLTGACGMNRQNIRSLTGRHDKTDDDAPPELIVGAPSVAPSVARDGVSWDSSSSSSAREPTGERTMSERSTGSSDSRGLASPLSPQVSPGVPAATRRV